MGLSWSLPFAKNMLYVAFRVERELITINDWTYAFAFARGLKQMEVMEGWEDYFSFGQPPCPCP